MKRCLEGQEAREFKDEKCGAFMKGLKRRDQHNVDVDHRLQVHSMASPVAYIIRLKVRGRDGTEVAFVLLTQLS